MIGPVLAILRGLRGGAARYATGRLWLRRALSVVAIVLPAYWVQSQTIIRTAATSAEAFPHSKHARLFTSCEGCHANVARPEADSIFPSASVCGSCHNGTDAKRVSWQPPARAVKQGLLRFSHRGHFASDTASASCTSCHGLGEQRRLMDVAPARAAECLGCHKQNAAVHFGATNVCSTCHVKLTQAGALSVAAVRVLPKPPSHSEDLFAQGHAPTTAVQKAQCATCHSKESCIRCHANGAALDAIASLGEDMRVKQIVGALLPNYPAPRSHSRDRFEDNHGADAKATIGSCANCHTQSSCETCHTGQGASRIIRALPAPQSGAQGVELRLPVRRSAVAMSRGVQAVRMLASVSEPAAADPDTVRRRGAVAVVVRPHPDNFMEDHRLAAAAGAQTCSGCHTTRFCSDCHAGESRRNFHPANFVAGHAASTYANDRNCASCHSTEVFCKSCHVASGIAPMGRNAALYHNAQPQWLLQHGRAARLEMTTCQSCHTQRSCLRCHSTTGWGVNPHGDNFDADRLGRKAMAMCARCHIRDPRKRE